MLLPSFFRTSAMSCCWGQAGAPSSVGGEVGEHCGELVGLGVAAGGLAVGVALDVGDGVGAGGADGDGDGEGDGDGDGEVAAWTGRAASPPAITSATTSRSGPLTPAGL
jgi:hypothetical protein